MRLRALIVTAILAVSVLGCTARADYTARFVGYDTLPDGTEVALVEPLEQADERQTAFTEIGDLEPGEFVLIHYTGRSWDMPQSTPEREVVARVSD